MNQMDRIKQSQRSRRRRRNRQLAMYGMLILFGGICVSAAWLNLSVRESRKMAGYTAEIVEKRNETEILGVGVSGLENSGDGLDSLGKTMADGVDITGLNRQQAEKKLLKQPWTMTVSYDGKTAPVEDILTPEITRMLDTIYEGDSEKTGEYQIDLASLKASARAFAVQWDRPPTNSQMVAFDKATGVYTYSEAEEGRTMNQEALADQIVESVTTGNYGAQLVPEFVITAPERTAAQAREQYKVVGSYTTKTTNNRNRNQNILLAVEAIDGRILKPGEEFSFNMATGNRTEEKGYQPAGAYRNGVLIEEPGGGVCQVSTTLYNALVNSGLQATERHSHSFAPTYIPSGQDAMVSFDGYAGPDLKFVNTEKTSVAIRASLRDNVLKISIVGLPILEEGVKVSMRSEKVRDVEPPAPVYEENENLAAGTENVVDNGQKGSVWQTFRVVTKGDQIVEETPLHNTTYRGKPAVIQKNEGGDGTAAGQTAISQPEDPLVAGSSADQAVQVESDISESLPVVPEFPG